MLLFDIGANVGNWALANNINNNNVVCVEASPSTFSKLCLNVGSHANITCLNYAVTNLDSPSVEFYECVASTLSTLDRDWLTHESSRFYSYRSNITPIRIKTITLDKLIDIYGTPNLIKVDVEGAENIVLKSLTRQVPQICFEWASEWNNKNFECIDYLEKLQYSKFDIQFSDEYTYRPRQHTYTSTDIKEILSRTTPKIDWGMIWCIKE
jgi:FkbM family methyltransferase